MYQSGVTYVPDCSSKSLNCILKQGKVAKCFESQCYRNLGVTKPFLARKNPNTQASSKSLNCILHASFCLSMSKLCLVNVRINA